MSGEIDAIRGRLASSEKVIEAVALSMDCTIDEIRCLADKYEDKAALESGKILVLAKRLDGDAKHYRELSGLISRLKKDLGE
jgi:ubiquinone biosynthesis protein UbiJ